MLKIEGTKGGMNIGMVLFIVMMTIILLITLASI